MRFGDFEPLFNQISVGSPNLNKLFPALGSAHQIGAQQQRITEQIASAFRPYPVNSVLSSLFEDINFGGQLLSSTQLATQGIVLASYENWTNPIKGLIGNLNHAFATSAANGLANLSTGLSSGLVFNTLPRFDLDGLISFPADWSEKLSTLAGRIQRGEDGRSVLADMDEAWLSALFNPSEFADWMDADDNERIELLDETVSELVAETEFPEKLQTVVEISQLTSPRWRIIRSALDAHYHDQFMYSVPLLLSQLEGMFADLLHLRQVVVRHDGQVYEIDPSTGQIKLNKKGRQVKVPGLTRLVELSEFSKIGYLEDYAAYITNATCKFRNGTLHGSSLDFDTDANSRRCALLLFVIASEFESLAEDAQDDSTEGHPPNP